MDTSMRKVFNADSFTGRMAILVDEYKNATHLAKVVGVNDRTIRKWMAGTEPARNYLELLAEKLEVNIEWLVLGRGPIRRVDGGIGDGTYVQIPLYDVRAGAGEGMIAEDKEQIEELMAFSRSWIRSELRTSPAHLSLIHVSGDSMEPTLRPGDVVLVDQHQAEGGTDGVYVLRRDGHLQIKRLHWLSGKVLKIISDNPIYQPIEVDLSQLTEEFQIIGRVIWGGKRF
ncbi:S24 family peptidase [Acaryochloris marina]|uniref:Peptidase, S24 family n=1 Tax=Acaryochloris marina (strain MBIC 11017) TaxID=329726 RepID=B0C586_ACAM1|nr:helix-turn-helix transcriptional regulator [Acaryochloris marina]ABW26326.1 peptidase, S24 family [Acaryochloris marina MBIC11017]